MKRHKVVGGAVSSQSWPKPSPVLIASIHGVMARLSGMDEYHDARPTKDRHQSKYYLGSM